MGTWATVADVTSITGKTVSEAQLASAEAVICIYSNRTPMASASIGARDLYWMKQATAWQAAWQPAQTGYMEQSRFKSMSQDGLSITRDAGFDHDLAPLAVRSLRNLSWKGDRTLRTGPPVTEQYRNFLLESSDVDGTWRPL